MDELRIALGSDVSGHPLKSSIVEMLREQTTAEVTDVGVDSPEDAGMDHADAATRVARLVAEGTADRGLLFCGNGLGVAIAANSVDGVSAVTAHDVFSVRTSLSRNRAQVLCMGAEVIGAGAAAELVRDWLAEPMPAPAD
ncbi:RpiB/LacA/LacB family sugar-phosphate isomerase [Nesterenkonia sp. F]|uniref:RpiB/LacA/LacB family sugar-phosphate isomerase n=1 Tax=Nesterenkonia sp. F TaxID=795955 RepID=UPI000255C8C2|nr:RpiB/LacA/LacB family sugar-phosphate isomerase [Nesterenkonia sp. F]